jgi:pimeloyl-ACP methyl ester carboxylesterase
VQSGAAERAAEALIDWVQGEPGSFRRLPRDIQNGLRANAPTVGPTYAAQGPVVTCTQLHSLRVPVLVLCGEQTRPWYRIIAAATSDCIPDAHAAVVPVARHMAIVENPHAFAPLIAGFLKRHSVGD